MKNFIYYENGWRWFETERLPLIIRKQELSAFKDKSLPIINDDALEGVSLEECPIVETSVPILQWPGSVEVKTQFINSVKVAILKQANGNKTEPIPIESAKEIATKFGYDQVVIIARKIGNDGVEHVTTYGKDKTNCKVAADIGNFLKYKVMNWIKEKAQ